MKDRMSGGNLLIVLAAIFACSLASELRIRQGERQPASGSDKTPGTLPSVDSRCSYDEYVRSGDCTCNCILEPLAADRTDCLSCNRTCLSDKNDKRCAVMSQDDCSTDTVSRTVGLYAKAGCISGLAKFMPCTPAPDLMPRTKDLTGGNSKRRLEVLKSSSPPCLDDLICKETSTDKFQCMNRTSGVCTIAQRTDSFQRCDSDGKYLQLQCRPVAIDGAPVPAIATILHFRLEEISKTKPYMCHCVNSGDSDSVVAGSMKMVVDRSDLNTFCKVENCKVTKDRLTFSVSHGDIYNNMETCIRCLCKNGELQECRSYTCPTTTSDCVMDDGTMIPNKGNVKKRCDICFCNRGIISCSPNNRCNKGDSQPNEEGCDNCGESDCQKCDKEINPKLVCTENGVGSLSRCHATHCSKIKGEVILDGSCRTQDPCKPDSCGIDEKCKKRGSVACLGSIACIVNQRVTCVNLTTHSCPASDDSSEDQKVCGTDLKTYNSKCDILRTDIEVLQDRSCNDPDCVAQKVCSCNGEEYSNPCELESQMSVRNDYRKGCIDSTGMTQAEKCKEVRSRTGTCSVTKRNCKAYIESTFTGCCPVCGGQVVLVLDKDAIAATAKDNPNFANVDRFTNSILDITDLRDVATKCRVWSEITNYGDLCVTFETIADEDEEFCSEKVKILDRKVQAVLSASIGSRMRRQDSEEFSQAFLYVTGSVTAVVEELSGAAVRLEAVAGMVALLLMVASGLMF